MAGKVFLTGRNWNKKLKQKIRRMFRRQLVLPRAKEAALFRLPAQVQQAQLVVHLLRPALAENRDA